MYATFQQLTLQVQFSSNFCIHNPLLYLFSTLLTFKITEVTILMKLLKTLQIIQYEFLNHTKNTLWFSKIQMYIFCNYNLLHKSSLLVTETFCFSFFVAKQCNIIKAAINFYFTLVKKLEGHVRGLNLQKLQAVAYIFIYQLLSSGVFTTELEQLTRTLQNTFLQITYLCRTLPVGCFQ